MTKQDGAAAQGPDRQAITQAADRTLALLELDPGTTPTVPLWPFTGRLLGISKSSTYAAAKTGQIPTLRLGKRLVVPTAALRQMLQLDDPASTPQAS